MPTLFVVNNTRSPARLFGEKTALAWEGPNSLASYHNDSIAEIPDEARLPMRVAGILGSVAFGAYLQNKLKKDLRRLQRANPQQVKKILTHFRLKDMPAVPYPKLDNAAYIEPEHFQQGWLSQGLHADDPHLRKIFQQNPKAVEHMRRHGLVIYDKKFATPAIIAHEAGHADIGNMPWYMPSKINQKYLRSLSDHIGGMLTPLAAISVGAMTRNPFLGAGAGALAGAALHAPTLINEWQATHRANKYLDEKMLEPKEREKSRRALGTAFNTYLASAAVPAAVMGGIAGGFANNASARDILGRLKPPTV